MTLSTVLSRAQHGIEAPLVRVETHISNGLPAFSIVGLPAAAVRESKDRVRSAIMNCHLEWPDQRLTVNLSPADLPKHGGRYDLPIALGILIASGQIPEAAVSGGEFLGELSLTGTLQAVSGTISAAVAASAAGHALFLPDASALNATAVPQSQIMPCKNLLQVSAHLLGNLPLRPASAAPPVMTTPYPDLADVRGQAQGKRALEVAAAGGHNLLYCGPPGTGKTMLASRLPGILPPLPAAEALEVLMVMSAANPLLDPAVCQQRPFRAPHHSASAKALVGGGSQPRPGEISMAHRGVLFLDELPEFSRSVLEQLREPLESGHITISRVQSQISFPARCQLVAAMNPCPCGYEGDPRHACRCTPDQIRRYRQRLSAPLLDRIDILLTLPRTPASELMLPPTCEESSAEVRQRVSAARALQIARAGAINSQLDSAALVQHCPLAAADSRLLAKALDDLGLSARAYHRILKLSRTIADLAGAEQIAREHLLEGMSYRQLQLHQDS